MPTPDEHIDLKTLIAHVFAGSQPLSAGLERLFVLLDRQGKLLNCSANCQELLPPAGPAGQTLFDLFPAPTAGRYLDTIRQVFETRQSFSRDEAIPVQGQELWFRYTLQLLSSAPGSPEQVLFSLEQITAKHNARPNAAALHSEQSRLAEIAGALPGLLFTVQLNPDNTLSMPYASSLLQEIYGLQAEQAAESLDGFFERISAEDAARLREEARQSSRNLSPWVMSFRYNHPRRGLLWVEGACRPVRTPQGGIAWHGFVMDVSERKRAEQALERFRLITENSRDIVLLIDFDTQQILEANPAAAGAYGYSLEELQNMRISDLRVGSLEDVSSQMAIVSAEGVIFEAQHRRKDGSAFPVEVSARGAITGGRRALVSIIRDISERKLLYARLVESEEKFARAFDTSPLLIAIADTATRRFIDVNQAFLEKLGYAYEQVIGRSSDELQLFPDEPRRRQAQAQLVQQGALQNFEMPVRASSGAIRQGLFSAQFFETQERRLQITLMEDITERKQIEMTLKQSEALFRAITEKGANWVVLLDQDFKVIYASPNYASVMGVTAATWLGADSFRLVHPDDRDWARRQMADIMRQPGLTRKAEVRSLHQDGSTRWVEVIATNLLDDPDVQAIVINGSDISARKAAQQAMQESEARYRVIYEGASEGILAMRQDFRVFDYANPALCSLFGYSLPEFLKLNVTDLYPLEEMPRMYKEFERMSRGEKTMVQAVHCRRKDGSLFYADISTSNTLLGGVSYVISFFNDITQRRRSELLLQARVWLASLPSETSLDELMQQTLDHAERVTDSQVGFFHFVEEDRVSIWLQNWSTNTLEKMCKADGKGQHYPVAEAGVWAESWRTRKAMICNDYAHAAGKRGMPAGHAEVERFISVPVISRGAIVALIGVGNKPTDYDQEDVEVVSLLATEAWEIILRKRAEAALQQSEAKYRSLVESMESIIATVDAAGVFHYMNPVAAAQLGGTPENLVGKTMHDLFPPQIADMQLNAVRRVIASGVGNVNENLSIVQGRKVWYRTSVQPILDANGKATLAFINSVDITLRKEAEKVLEEMVRSRTAELEMIRQRLELATHSAGIGVWERSIVTKEQIWDDQTLALFGRTRAEFETTPRIWESSIHPDDMALVSEQIRIAVQETGRLDTEFRIVWPDQSVHYLKAQAVVIYDEAGRPERMLGINYDITAHIQADKILRSSEEMLRQANAELERAIRMKDEFLASMSHELRTPLTGILGLSEALQYETYGPLNERQRHSLELIESGGRHLLELITDILDISKIEAGRLDLQIETGSLNEICQSSLHLVKGLQQKKSLQVGYTISPADILITGDQRRIKQALVNLLSNAIKFTPEGGSLGLEVSAEAAATGDEAAGFVRLVVWDTGIGIRAEDLKNLFQPFIQLDSKLSRQYTGTGLGLALVKRLVELHHGRVEVESTPGQGSRFTIYLPWRPQPKVEKKEIETDGLPCRALVVENDPNQAELLAHYLQILGSGSTWLPDGSDLLAQARACGPDVVLINQSLPGRSGWDLLVELKRSELAGQMPVIITSQTEERTKAALLGADGFLTWPITLRDLRGALELARQAGAQAANPPQPESGLLVMVVDDSEVNNQMVVDFLSMRGLRVASAASGFEFLEKVPQVRPDVILMDIQMPGMDGLEAIRRLRSHADAEVAALPVIAITALAMPGDRERCLQAGANAYLSKPVHLAQLLELVQKMA